MKIKKKILITFLSFVGLLALAYLAIFLSLPPVRQGPVLVTSRDILGEPSEAYKPVLAKIKRGEPLTKEEQRIRQKEEIRGLAQFDPKAAAYAQEMLEQGYLEVSKADYLRQKEKEFSQWVSDEMRRYYEKKHPNSNIKWPKKSETVTVAPARQGPSLVTSRDILGEPSEEFKRLMAKMDEDEDDERLLTPEEERIMREEEIRELEQFDPKAASYAREMLEHGTLEPSKYEYLSQKRKEFNRWVLDEMHR